MCIYVSAKLEEQPGWRFKNCAIQGNGSSIWWRMVEAHCRSLAAIFNVVLQMTTVKGSPSGVGRRVHINDWGLILNISFVFKKLYMLSTQPQSLIFADLYVDPAGWWTQALTLLKKSKYNATQQREDRFPLDVFRCLSIISTKTHGLSWLITKVSVFSWTRTRNQRIFRILIII